MSQFDWGIIDPNSKSGPQLALDLNDFRDALNTLHRGANRPPYAQPGMAWVKEVSSERWELTLFDGSVDLMLRAFNPTTSSLIPFAFSDIEGLADALSKAVQKDAATTTGAALIPGGSSAQRPSTPVPGMQRFNADLSEFERYQGGKWLALNMMDKALNEAPIVTLASAATVNIGAAAANTISVSGTATITGFDTIAAGARRKLVFQGALTLTHNASSLILPGAASITTAAGDVAEFVSLGSGNWKCTGYARASGKALIDDGFKLEAELLWSGSAGSAGAVLTLSRALAVGDLIYLEHTDANKWVSAPVGIVEVVNGRLYDATFGAAGHTGFTVSGGGSSITMASFTSGFGVSKVFALKVAKV